MRTSNKATILRTVFFLDISPRHSNIMADKWLNISEKYATRCVNLSSQEKECCCPSWGDSNYMYIFGSIVNSQRISSKMKKTNVCYCQSKNVSETNDAAKHKAFIIIKYNFHVLCYFDDISFVCECIQKILSKFTFHELKLFFQISLAIFFKFLAVWF